MKKILILCVIQIFNTSVNADNLSNDHKQLIINNNCYKNNHNTIFTGQIIVQNLEYQKIEISAAA